MAVDDQARLACGRPIEDVWEHADQPPNAHEAGCGFCTDARAGLARLTAATDELKRHDDADPDLRIGATVKTAIMGIAHAEVRRTRRIPLEQTPPDQVEAPLTISEQAITTVVRAAADTVPGVRARRCSVDLDKDTQTVDLDKDALASAASELQPAAIHVDLRLVVSAAIGIPAAMAEVRHQVTATVAERVGVSVTSIQLTVEDLYDA